ncbi:hypothetical protein EV421DRAFT_1735760 [Armillaria borealis]|uniref:Uncharacterized protein n=1 Tax=Armillaria borealis TaxID=47425 RepID=A0AA39MRJ9_9AGAR|nr:hypothetical protein EV421DRAFT_1735760 [Armillaria borealis]
MSIPFVKTICRAMENIAPPVAAKCDNDESPSRKSNGHNRVLLNYLTNDRRHLRVLATYIMEMRERLACQRAWYALVGEKLDASGTSEGAGGRLMTLDEPMFVKEYCLRPTTPNILPRLTTMPIDAKHRN